MRIELHYLPNLEYMIALTNASQVLFEVNEHYCKQTYRNRARILTSNGTLDLIVPVLHHHGSKQLIKDVKIDYSQNWIKQHQGTMTAAYGKSAYFEYFATLFFDIYSKKTDFLVDLNICSLELITKLLGFKLDYQISDRFIEEKDPFYDIIKPKASSTTREIYTNLNYRQCFGENFEPNLSILDLLMNHGRESLNILKKSSKLN